MKAAPGIDPRFATRHNPGIARMVPTPMLPVQSHPEQQLYEGLRDQLPDEFTCYYGIAWLRLGRRPEEGESDFLVAHPNLGVLVVEIKGGELSFDPASRKWRRRGDPKLVKDPFDQAQRNMHWLKDQPATMHGNDRWMPSLGFVELRTRSEVETDRTGSSAQLRVSVLGA